MTLARSSNKQDRLTASQPILENFGHAKTRHNHNSSRVGKFVSLEFSTTGRLTGARVEQYLLEISRVIQRHPYERNFLTPSVSKLPPLNLGGGNKVAPCGIILS